MAEGAVRRDGGSSAGPLRVGGEVKPAAALKSIEQALGEMERGEGISLDEARLKP